jgi:predicted RNA-binding protein Jag
MDIFDLIKTSNVTVKKLLQFKVLVFVIALLVVFKIIYNGNYINVISLLAFVYFIVNKYLGQQNTNSNDLNKLIDLRLRKIQKKVNEYIKHKLKYKNITKSKARDYTINANKMTSLYIDANMITFLESIIEMYDYNPDEYYQLIKGTNNILKIRLDIERFLQENNDYIQGIHQQLDIAIQLRMNCINNVHNFIYTVPKSGKMTNYINKIIGRYTELIDSNINIIKKYSQDFILRDGINNQTQFIDNLDAKPNLQTNSDYFFYI